MQSDPKHTHDHGHTHSHVQSRGQLRGQLHDHAHPHVLTSSQGVESGTPDLKSPVLMSGWHRLLYASVFLGILWLTVLWALHTND